MSTCTNQNTNNFPYGTNIPYGAFPFGFWPYAVGPNTPQGNPENTNGTANGQYTSGTANGQYTNGAVPSNGGVPFNPAFAGIYGLPFNAFNTPFNIIPNFYNPIGNVPFNYGPIPFNTNTIPFNSANTFSTPFNNVPNFFNGYGFYGFGGIPFNSANTFSTPFNNVPNFFNGYGFNGFGGIPFNSANTFNTPFNNVPNFYNGYGFNGFGGIPFNTGTTPFNSGLTFNPPFNVGSTFPFNAIPGFNGISFGVTPWNNVWNGFPAVTGWPNAFTPSWNQAFASFPWSWPNTLTASGGFPSAYNAYSAAINPWINSTPWTSAWLTSVGFPGAFPVGFPASIHETVARRGLGLCRDAA